MPTYDYECRSCGYSFETIQSMLDDSLTLCPECGKEQLRRLISGGAGIIFKGSGFYVNDSRDSSSSTSVSKPESAGSGKSVAAKSDSQKSDSQKSETKKSADTKTGSSESSSKVSA